MFACSKKEEPWSETNLNFPLKNGYTDNEFALE